MKHDLHTQPCAGGMTQHCVVEMKTEKQLDTLVHAGNYQVEGHPLQGEVDHHHSAGVVYGSK